MRKEKREQCHIIAWTRFCNNVTLFTVPGKGCILIKSSFIPTYSYCTGSSVVRSLLYSNMAASSPRILVFFYTYLCFFSSPIKNMKCFMLLHEKIYVNSFTVWKAIPLTFHVPAWNCSYLLGQCNHSRWRKSILHSSDRFFFELAGPLSRKELTHSGNSDHNPCHMQPGLWATRFL
jgi:hypothetical protein